MTMAGDAKDLSVLRGEIDAVDVELLRLINTRAALAIKVGTAKRQSGEGVVYYRPEREAAILRRILERNTGPLSSPEAARLMREIMSACLALEHPLIVAYLGPEGTYTHLAALKHFGRSIEGAPAVTIDEVMREVEAGSADYGVVPVENSLEGGINQTLDALRESPLKICGEVVLSIHHQLLSAASDIADIHHVYAHTQALGQCRHWLAANLPTARCTAISSNGEAARRVRGEPDAAAIAGEAAADIYDLAILRRNIEDHPGNTTRFVVLGEKSPAPSGKDVTSLMFTTPNRPGALHDVLSILAAANISLSRIESRPLRQEVWDYVFFVDIEGHADSETVRNALVRLDAKTSLLKVLGSYPRAVV
jgi:chorismate mutase / prephenate dehydratase